MTFDPSSSFSPPLSNFRLKRFDDFNEEALGVGLRTLTEVLGSDEVAVAPFARPSFLLGGKEAGANEVSFSFGSVL